MILIARLPLGNRLLILFVMGLTMSCGNRLTQPLITPESEPSIHIQTGNDSLPTPTASISRRTTVTSGTTLVEFGWLADGRIYYAVGGNPAINSVGPVKDVGETAWYAFDSVTDVVERIQAPIPTLSNEILQTLAPDQAVDILNVAIAPSENKVLYTRLPDNYQRPNTPPPHYADPMEIWVSENLSGDREQIKTYPILNRVDSAYECGNDLAAESRWFDNETLVLGSCFSRYGILRVYFLADLVERRIQFLNFETSAGEYIPSEEIAIAQNTVSLAFYSSLGLWTVPVGKQQRNIPLVLTESNLLFNDRVAVAPTWSFDDQWIYYWTIGRPAVYDEYGFSLHQPWWLEKVNFLSRERKIVLSESDLSSLLGADLYQRPQGAGEQWRLSPDETQILLYLRESMSLPPTLLLIDLQQPDFQTP